MRDYEALLRDEPCWDASTQALYEARGEPLQDRALQNRAELAALCAFIEDADIRSYLEIGAWTGRLAGLLHRLFGFDAVAVVDDGYAARFGLALRAPPGARVFVGDSKSEEYADFRAELGHVDLVIIDADHRYAGVRRDFEINRAFPHRFLVFHDITGANRHTAGVGRLWRELDEGWTREICLPNPDLGERRSTMGLGIWCAQEPGIAGFAPAGGARRRKA